ncbi:MAG TPA: gliding motility-associated C-terminal domain-containing protein, partial [Saprospiraceae bacterium]|nr:gliding motility-associated C-terminal domain-containing protein [Saprospiraceae bacterium]
DANGCTNSDTASITVNDCGCLNPASVDAGQDLNICLSDPQISLSGVLGGGATTATWSGGTGTYTPNDQDLNAVYTPSQAELDAGSVTLTLITNDPDGSGPCVPATSQVIFTFTQVNIQGVTMANNGFIDCSGIPDTLVGSATSSDGGAVTGFWKDENGTILSPSFTLIAGAPGTYTFVAENGIGCQDSTMVTVNSSVNVPDISATVSGPITCQDSLVILLGSSTSSNVVFTWTEPDGTIRNGSDMDVNIPGQYTFTVLDTMTNCPATMDVAVLIDTMKPTVVTLTGEITCADTLGDILVNNVNNLDLSYSWLFPDGVTMSNDSSLIDMNQGGVYQLHLVDNHNGCSSDLVDSIVLNNQGPLNLEASSSLPLNCVNPSTQLNATTTTANVVFEWNGPNNFKTNDPTPIVQEPGKYLLRAFGPNGCVSEQLLIIDGIDTIQPPMSPFTNDTIDCVSQTAILYGNSISTAVNFAWYENGTLIGVGDSIEVTGAGNYGVIATDQNNGCTSNGNIVVPDDTDAPLITLMVDGVVNCYGNSVPATLSSNRPLDSISWSGPGLSIQDDTTILIDEAGTYQVYIVGDNGCVGQKDFNVDADTIPPLAAGVANFEVTCTVDKGTLAAEGSSSGSHISYAWDVISNGNILSGYDSYQPYVQGAGQYLLTVTDHQNGCTASTEVDLPTNGNIPVDLDYDAVPVQCNGFKDGAIIIRGVQGGESPYLYRLDDGPFGQNKIFSPIPPGDYQVTIQDVNGCTMERTLTVGEPDLLVVDLGPDQIVKLGDGVSVSAEVNDPNAVQSFMWNEVFDSSCVGNLNCFTQDFYPAKSVTLRATVIDDSGCKATDDVNIFVDDTPNIFVPNIFSPNRDGGNDFFTVYSGQGVKEVYDLEIYDRWGTKVYYAPIVDGSNGWDGFFRDKELPEAVYVYQFYVLLDNGEVKFFTGDVTLVR